MHRWWLAVWWLSVCLNSSESLRAAGNVARGRLPFIIDVWETDDGLPQNSVISMIQTRDGYLWLGTLNGLVRFDGVRFTVFDESNTPGLTSSQIVSLFEDSRSNLWVGTESGGAFLIKDGRVTSLDIGRGTREGRLRASCEDSSGAVWLYTADGQLCRHRDGRVDVWTFGGVSLYRGLIQAESGAIRVGVDWGLFTIGPTGGLGATELPQQGFVPLGKLDFLLASRRGGHWRLSEGRVYKWGPDRMERDFGPYPWGAVAVSAACEDREGNLVVGTLGGGVFWFDADGKVTRLSTEQGLSYNYILSLTVDREGSLWVGTDGGGLDRVKRKVFDTLEDSRGLVVQSVCADAQGDLWIGYNGGGVDHCTNGVCQRLRPRLGSIDLSVKAVFADRQGRIWAGTGGGGILQFRDGQFQRAPGSESIHPYVSAIHQDAKGNVWVGTRGGLARWDEHGWRVFGTHDGLPAEVVQAIAEDRAGNLWIGTSGGGLCRWREGDAKVFRKEDGLPADTISCLLVDEAGILWIGTAGGGLGRFDGSRWTRYTIREGLTSNAIGYLMEDGQDHLWIGSNFGLTRVAKKSLNDVVWGVTNIVAGRSYGRPDGLPTRECSSGSQPAACRTRDGRLWFPTINGLASLGPVQLEPNPYPPPVMIEAALVEGQLQNTNSLRPGPTQTVRIPPGKERLEIQYTSLNLAAADRARFRYRLEGHETAWTEAGNSRSARYSKLPPGHYRFEVTACNEDGVWNEAGAGLAIVVEPPVWRTWWFLSLTAAGFLGSVVAVVYYLSTQKLQRQLERFRQQQALEKERSRIARDLHDQLGASLTQVALLGELVESDKDSPGDVEGHARQISQTARETTRSLDEIVWAANPSNDTLDGLINYVCKYAQEYLAVAGVRYRLDVPAGLPAVPLPPEVRHNVFLASKEALTNVVRHAKAQEVRIGLKLVSDSFTLEIADNGRGLGGMDQVAAQSRNGLRNMRKRMEDVGGSFFIEPSAEGGTLVRLNAPLASH